MHIWIYTGHTGDILTPPANKPVMGIVRDTLCGIRKFTPRDTLDWNQVQHILLRVPEWDGSVRYLLS